MNSQSFIILLAYLTFFSNLLLIVVLPIYIFLKLNKSFKGVSNKFRNLLKKHSLKIMLLIALMSTSGSLYLSEIEGLVPCNLCWYQRVFMYPLCIIMATALLFKLKDVFRYVLPLAFVGLIIAGYHYYYQTIGSSTLTCSIVSFSPSCSERYYAYFGYITISWMSLSAFTYIFLLSLFGKSSN
jgi:disulfide bond formation protein DsbB